MNMTELAQAIHGGLIQQDRLLKTDIPSLPNNALVPRRAVICSELGRDFSVTLDLVSTASDVELKTFIAQPMTLWINRSTSRISRSTATSIRRAGSARTAACRATS